jgi:FtsP/CotA-like multicopper oxidase with cupredoxin domain
VLPENVCVDCDLCWCNLPQVTTNVPLGAGQYWDIINLSGDSQPIHLHNVDFEVRAACQGVRRGGSRVRNRGA